MGMSASALEAERPPGPALWMPTPLNLTLANLSPRPQNWLKGGGEGGPQSPKPLCLLRQRLRGGTCLHASYSHRVPETAGERGLAAQGHTQRACPAPGGPGIPARLPERKGVSHRQARSGRLFPGKGKEGKRGNQKAWRRAGAGCPYLPGTALAELPAPALAKPFSRSCSQRGTQGR